jgi:orotidine-5'-phosphate decarboxylase
MASVALASVHVADRLQERMDRTGSIACVGLDPRPDMIPPALAQRAVDEHGDTAEAVATAFAEFNRVILDAVAGACAAVKPQVACYEAYGSAGWSALAESVRHAHTLGIEVVVDGKRGDIGSTAAHYRQGFFGGAPTFGGAGHHTMPADWTTVNGYLGSDNVLEMVAAEPGGHGIFVLVKTSNQSSGELQDIATGEGTMAEIMARLVHRWGTGRAGRSGITDVGAVVGATYPSEAKALRTLMPDALFLVPGYGAQGGDAVSSLAGVRDDGRGVLVSASRSITSAWQASGAPEDFAGAARAALDEMNTALTAAR